LVGLESKTLSNVFLIAFLSSLPPNFFLDYLCSLVAVADERCGFGHLNRKLISYILEND
jgi:hypothetical protein